MLYLLSSIVYVWGATGLHSRTSLIPLHLLPLGHIIKQHDISFHCYADDTQLYLFCKPSESAKLSSLHCCLAAVKDRMLENFLQLNSSKTEILIINPEHTDGQVVPALGSLAQHAVPTVKTLGVILDQKLTLESHVKSLAQSCFFHLRNISRIRSFMSFNYLQRVIHALITSRLDYCNAVFTCLGQNMTAQLQGVQNAAARLLTSHESMIISTLCWLPFTAESCFIKDKQKRSEKCPKTSLKTS